MVWSLSHWVVRRAGRAAHGRAVDRVRGRRRRRRRRRRRFVHVLVDRATAGVHEEVDDRRHLEAELLGDRRLNLLARALDLLEDGDQRSPLDLREHHARLLGGGGGRAGRLLLRAASVDWTLLLLWLLLLRRDRHRRRRQERTVSTALAPCTHTRSHVSIHTASSVIV